MHVQTQVYHVYTLVYTHLYTNAHVCVHVFTPMCIHICTHMCIHVCTYKFMYTSKHPHPLTCPYKCLCTCLCTFLTRMFYTLHVSSLFTCFVFPGVPSPMTRLGSAIGTIILLNISRSPQLSQPHATLYFSKPKASALAPQPLDARPSEPKACVPECGCLSVALLYLRTVWMRKQLSPQPPNLTPLTKIAHDWTIDQQASNGLGCLDGRLYTMGCGLSRR